MSASGQDTPQQADTPLRRTQGSDEFGATGDHAEPVRGCRPSLVAPEQEHRGVLWWRVDPTCTALSSAPVGGGFSQPAWLINVGVPFDYSRTDLTQHAQHIARGVGLNARLRGQGCTRLPGADPGIAMFTAADVSAVQHVELEGVAVSATVGVTKPTWAADPTGGWTPWSPGTINIVVQVPVRLGPGALVNAVMTVTEAKAQALWDTGVPGTGTASDAVVVLCPGVGRMEPFAGPRSRWGSRVARGVHDAVRHGLRGRPC